MFEAKPKNRITECHVTLVCNDGYAVDRVTSTFALREREQMRTAEELVMNYVASRKSFTVTYS